MRYLVAVSGGVDSVVLLDKLARAGTHDIIVAHFDHGIRSESRAEARFVGELAKIYHFPFTSKREELGPNASEQTARARRYAFLRQQAKKHQAVIVTAHHADDTVESVAINLTRGTGWRGLAVLAASDVKRPLLELPKAEIYDYACKNRLEWVEDSTNVSQQYLRNRLRRRTAQLTAAQRLAILKLRQKQCGVAARIDDEATRLIMSGDPYERHIFVHGHDAAALELLRTAIRMSGHLPPTRPQLQRALLAVKTARPGAVHDVGGKVRLRFTTRTFIVSPP